MDLMTFSFSLNTGSMCSTSRRPLVFPWRILSLIISYRNEKLPALKFQSGFAAILKGGVFFCETLPPRLMVFVTELPAAVWFLDNIFRASSTYAGQLFQPQYIVWRPGTSQKRSHASMEGQKDPNIDSYPWFRTMELLFHTMEAWFHLVVPCGTMSHLSTNVGVITPKHL